MKIKNVKIFKSPEDFRNWEKLIQHCEKIEGFTDFEKEKCKRAFQFLREELGDNFLERAFDEQHPICLYLVNLAPWTRKWIIWFAEALKELRKAKNYSNLLNRIKDGNRFSEGLSVLESAYKFSKAGFEITIDPPVDVSKREKIPDLKLIDEDTKEESFVEVSILGESKASRDAFQTMDKIIQSLWPYVPFIHYCGRIYKAISERHLNEIVKKIKEVAERAKNENQFHELVIEDTIEVGIAPESDKQLLEKWAEERGLKVGEVIGPLIDVNEILRTKRKIEKEQRQLPHNHPNILIVRNNNLFFGIRDIRKAISELEEEVYNYPHLLSVIVSGRHLGASKHVTIMKDHHVFIKKTRADLLTEQYIILLNRFCDFKISPAMIAKIYSAFKNY